MVTASRSTSIAKRLRRESTDAERMLWFHIRDRRLDGWKFKRQVPIEGYVVDFLCVGAHLIIEVDGGQHAARIAADARRTRALEAAGSLVLRFWNNDVLENIDGVLEEIVATLRPRAPHPNPLPGGERGPR
jgi:very-short-patch-repair endonuclease